LKTLLFFMVLASSLYSDAKIYTGANYGFYNESFTNTLAESSNQLASIKLGYGKREAYAIECSLEFLKNNSKIFSAEDANKYAFNLELIKAFELTKHLNPFVKIGFGTGILKIERKLQSGLSYGTFNVGLGAYIPLSEHFDFEVGYLYKAASYEQIDTIVEQTSYKSDINMFYTGLNVRF
jgi:hypothetical protein